MHPSLLRPGFALALVTGVAAAASPTYTPQFSAGRLSADVRTLASDAFEGRGPATRGETRTLDYLIARFKAAGVQPGGDLVDGRRRWTQAVPLAESRILGTPAITLALGGERVALTQGEQIALRAPQTGQTTLDIRAAPLVFVGYGIHAPERQWDDFKGVDLKGKIAVALVNDPDYASGAGDFGGKAMTYYGRWTYKYEEAARQGALGLLIVHDTAPASYGWPTVKNSNTNTMFDIVRAHPTEVHPPLEGWIQRDLAVRLFKAAGFDFDAEAARATRRDFAPVVLGSTALDVSLTAERRVITSYNVVGRVPGRTHPEQTVIYTAHWDHLGIGQPDARGDRIYNGAKDNGTGLAMLLELARAFGHGPRPARSVVFLAVTAEEKGLLGSEYYADHPLYPLATTVADINMDAMDPYGPAHDFTTRGSDGGELLDRLIALGKQQGRRFTPDAHLEAGYFFRSDHFPFAKRGVPAISFGSGDDWVDGGVAAGQAADQRYVREHYHQPSDEWQRDWTFTGMVQDLRLVYALGNSLANDDSWPNWGAQSEFRAAREASAAARR